MQTDVHYQRWAINSNEVYSGFQGVHANDICKELELNVDIMQMVYKMDDLLFSHAGISQTWLELMKIKNDENMVDLINDYGKFKPNVFAFGALRTRSYCDPYGDDIFQGPTWIRPRSLMKDSKGLGYTQIVGHTTQKQIDIEGKSTGGKYYFIDTLGTSGEYLIIEDRQITTGKI